MKNFGRQAIISDTTRTVQPVNIIEGDPNTDGWYIEVDCPVHGREIMALSPMKTRAEAEAAIAELF
jgi:hypothetical protein